MLSPTQAAGIQTTPKPPVHPAVTAIAKSVVKSPIQMLGRAATSGMLASGLSAFSKFLELAGGGQQEAGKVPAGGSGFLSGFAGVQKYKQDQAAAMDDATKNKAITAHENAEMVVQQKLAHQMDQDSQNDMIDRGKKRVAELTSQRVPPEVLQTDINSDQLQTQLAQDKLDPTQQHAYATGTDSQGRTTYTILGNLPTYTFSKDDAAEYAKLFPNETPIAEGSSMTGTVANSLFQKMDTAQTALDARNATLDKEKADQDRRNLAAENSAFVQDPTWVAALAHNRNNPYAAADAIQSNPAIAKKYPHLNQDIASAYGYSDVADFNRARESDRTERLEEQREKLAEQKEQREEQRQNEVDSANDQVDAALQLSDTTDPKTGISPRQAALAKVPLRQRNIAINDAKTEAAESIAALKQDPSNQDAQDNLATAQARMAALQPRPPKSNNNNPPATQPATAEQQARNDQAVENYKNTQSAAENRAGVEGALGTIIGNPALGANKSNLIDPDTYIKQHPDLDSGQQQAIRNFANPPAMVTVKLPNGRVGQIPPSQLQKFLQENPGSSQVQ